MADGIQFEEEQQYQSAGSVEQKSFFVRLVLATGIVSKDEQVKYVLFGTAIVFGIIAIAISMFSGGKPAHPLTKPPSAPISQPNPYVR